MEIKDISYDLLLKESSFIKKDPISKLLNNISTIKKILNLSNNTKYFYKNVYFVNKILYELEEILKLEIKMRKELYHFIFI